MFRFALLCDRPPSLLPIDLAPPHYSLSRLGVRVVASTLLAPISPRTAKIGLSSAFAILLVSLVPFGSVRFRSDRPRE